MKHAVNFLSGALLVIGVGGSILMPNDFFQRLTTTLLLLTALLSIPLGAYWASRLRTLGTRRLNGAGLGEAIDGVMKNELRWLQGIRPKVDLIDAKAMTDASVTTSIRKQYMSSAVLGIALLGGGALVLMGLGPQDGRGLFGALLATGAGRAVAVALSTYLLLSSASAYLAGVFLIDFKGRTS